MSRILDEIEESRRNNFDILKSLKKVITEEEWTSADLSEEVFYEVGDIPAESKLMGRIKLIRSFGGITFYSVIISGEVKQLVCNKQSTEDYAQLIYVNTGDVIMAEIKGCVKNKSDEFIPLIEKWKLVAKCFFELPSKHSGLKNLEKLYKQRYLSVISNPTQYNLFKKINQANSLIRSELDSLGYMSVEPLILESDYGGANARPFKTELNDSKTNLFLSIAPELSLKRYIVAGFNKVYNIAHCFRNESIGTRHHPEFLMLQGYSTNANCKTMTKLAENLIKKVLGVWGHEGQCVLSLGSKQIKLNLFDEFKTIKYEDAVNQYFFTDSDQNWSTASFEDIKCISLKKNKPLPNTILSKDDYLLMWLFGEFVESNLIYPTHVTEHPVLSTPLCSRHSSGRLDRVETYFFGIEITNMYSERSDFIELENAYYIEALKKVDASEHHTYNRSFLKAMAYGMPLSGGFGIGLHRLHMIASGCESIKDVLFQTLSNIEQTSMV